jgi:hypothetical protein
MKIIYTVEINIPKPNNIKSPDFPSELADTLRTITDEFIANDVEYKNEDIDFPDEATVTYKIIKGGVK